MAKKKKQDVEVSVTTEVTSDASFRVQVAFAGGMLTVEHVQGNKPVLLYVDRASGGVRKVWLPKKHYTLLHHFCDYALRYTDFARLTRVLSAITQYVFYMYRWNDD